MNFLCISYKLKTLTLKCKYFFAQTIFSNPLFLCKYLPRSIHPPICSCTNTCVKKEPDQAVMVGFFKFRGCLSATVLIIIFLFKRCEFLIDALHRIGIPAQVIRMVYFKQILVPFLESQFASDTSKEHC